MQPCLCADGFVCTRCKGLNAIRAVRAPRLTVEQMEAVKEADDDCEHWAARKKLRDAFPEAFAGELGEVGK
jgi:hypothetical protein